MELIHFHHFADGRPVSFDRNAVFHAEGHSSGAGTFVRLEPRDRPFELHLTEPYDEFMTEMRMSTTDRVIREMRRREAAGEADNDAPF